ncbi:unnamed protein product [Leptidea sinapis]|uniref:Aminopeptidase n=1 Tax=Leptidea sinapis TaxID=189913 RepID=A0A5E4QTH1_9NEOP|nr:unnamed protein product [Leptidea sinapis]
MISKRLNQVLFGLTAGDPIRTRDASYEHYVLPGESYPTFYDVSLVIDPDYHENFNGSAVIRIIPNQNVQEIVLHAMAMTISRIALFSESNTNLDLFSSYTLVTDDTHFLRIRSNALLLQNQPYSLHIEYTATYAENMFGVYVSTFEQPGVGTVNLVTSQLQPTFARRAFPCYDEPSYKAQFRMTIYAPAAYPVVRTNMPQKTTNLIKPEIPNFVKYEFEDTVVMSSYLLAYLVSNFDHLSNEGNQIYDIPFRVYSRPGTQNTAIFALDFGQRNMMALENYTEFRYALPKLDKAAVPDFAAGAMENWGLVIYREVALLVTEGVTTTATKQNIGRIICHENMHMWFGNEVSPVSWTYTWLNEGFANFFENFGTDLYCDSNIVSFYLFIAGSVIRMMQHFLTPEIFRQGLVHYLRSFHESLDNTRRFSCPNCGTTGTYCTISIYSSGYYRVNYDTANWRALANVLLRSHEDIHLLNRAQIIDDAFNLARNGRLNYEYAFEVSRYLTNESDYIAWGAANAAFNYLDVQYILELSAPLYESLGFIAKDNEEHVTAFHRNIILDINCRNGNQQCISTFTLNPDIQTVVFCSGLRGGDVENFNFLWNMYQTSSDSSVQAILLNSLGCTSNETLRDSEQDRHSIVVSVTNSSPENMEAALDFVLENFAAIQPRVQGLTGTTNILNTFARRLTSRQHSEKIEEFERRYNNIFSAGERASVAAIKENIAASITWSENYYNQVNTWLNTNYGSSASTIGCSLVLLVSVFLTIIR